MQKPSNGVQRLSDHLITCEIANLTFAATDTTSVVLSFLFWELALHPELQEQLRSELQQIQVRPGSDTPARQNLVNLPFLNAVIQEKVRRHSPIPMGLLRKVPPGGCVIDGYFIPGEVRTLCFNRLFTNFTSMTIRP
jgi:cytochrome P450